MTNLTQRGLSLRGSLLAGLAGLAAFALIASTRLSAQGLSHEEAGVFRPAFMLKNPAHAVEGESSALLCISRIPVLVFSYESALQADLYGLLLRVFRADFTVVGVRSFDIGLVAAGIAVFCVLARDALSPLGAGLFLTLLLSDASVVLACRFDASWNTISLLLRLLLIGLWLREELSDGPAPRDDGLIGLVWGLAVFDKLLAALWAGPILVCFACSRHRRSARHRLAFFGGLLCGALPLIIANTYTKAAENSLISMEFLTWGTHYPKTVFLELIRQYGGLGLGQSLRFWNLATIVPEKFVDVERAFLFAGAVFAAVVCLPLRRREPAARCVPILLASYAALAVEFGIFPLGTAPHHWLLGTPFQYAAVGIAASCVDGAAARRGPLMRAGHVSAVLVVCGWLALRVAMAVDLQRDFVAGKASQWHDPALAALGRFAADHRREAVFVAVDFGIANSIYCLAQGAPELVVEYGQIYEKPNSLKSLLNGFGKSVFYTATSDAFSHVGDARRQRVFNDVARLKGWREAAVEPELARLDFFGVRKFIRARRRNSHQ